MNSDDREKLLKEILPREDLADFRQTSLEHGLTRLRRQRRTRYALRTVAAVAAFCFLSLAIFLKPHHPAPNNVSVAQSPQPVAAPAPTDHVTFITDDELLAVFTNRPVALIGKPGQQRLVFLDQVHEPAHPF